MQRRRFWQRCSACASRRQPQLRSRNCLPPQSTAYTVIRNFAEGTDLEKEARDAACPVKRFFAKAKKNVADWFYQTMPIAE